MKILFTGYINVPEFTDPHKWLRRIKGYCGILEKLSNLHEVISIEQINYSGTITENGVTYHFLNFKKKNNRVPINLHRFISKINPDIIVIHSFHFPLQVILLRMQLRKTKIIIQNHAEKPGTGLKKIAQKLADNFINAYMFTAVEMGEEWVHQKIISRKEKIWGIMEGSSFFQPIAKDVARIKTGIKEKTIYLFVGRLDANKDPMTVVKAFLQFAKTKESVHLYMIFATDELLKEIKNILSKNNCTTVTLIGKVPHDEMQFWFSASDFIVSASHYEGSGIAVCEAMSCGCIPLLTNILSFNKITGYGSCGYLYEPADVAALTTLLEKTVHMNIEEEKQKVLKQFREDLSFTAIATQLAEKIKAL